MLQFWPQGEVELTIEEAGNCPKSQLYQKKCNRANNNCFNSTCFEKFESWLKFAEREGRSTRKNTQARKGDSRAVL